MDTDLAATRARELVGDAVWRKLSARTQANIIRAELREIILERVAHPVETSPVYRDLAAGPAAPLAPSLFSLPDTWAADKWPAAGPQWVGQIEAGQGAANLSMWAPLWAAANATAPGIQGPDAVPSFQALRKAADAVCRGYGLTEVPLSDGIIGQAVDLSFLLMAYDLVSPKAQIAMSPPDTAGEMQREPATEVTADRPSTAGRRVLVVDDVSDVLVTVAAFLTSAGFVVVTAADGDTALRLIATDKLIGILVTDFVMPGLSGADLIAQAMQLRPDLRALLITGYPNADGLANLPPGVAILAKPFRRAALIERLSGLSGTARSARADAMAEIAPAIR